MRTVLTNEALEKTLTRERLSKYLQATRENLDAAIGLYERNNRLSEAFYTPLQSLEICLRNSISGSMDNAYGEEWFQNGGPPLGSDSSRMIIEAKEEIRKGRGPVTPGAVIAELKFAFWVGLLGPGYDATLWRGHLHKVFLNGGGKPRKEVHSRLNAIRRFRNRIAHHEPIFHKDLQTTHNEIIGTIRWMCTQTSAWANHHSRFSEVFALD